MNYELEEEKYEAKYVKVRVHVAIHDGLWVRDSEATNVRVRVHFVSHDGLWVKEWKRVVVPRAFCACIFL